MDIFILNAHLKISGCLYFMDRGSPSWVDLTNLQTEISGVGHF